MASCNPSTTVDTCNMLPSFLDITNQIELAIIVFLQTLMVVLVCYIAWRVFRDQIWRKMEGSEKVLIVVILSLLLAAGTIYILGNILQIILYARIYYQSKTAQEIEAFKDVYLLFAESVPVIINNIYLALCILWEVILKKCLISSSKRIYIWIGIVAFVYNSAAVSIYVLDVISGTQVSDNLDPTMTFWVLTVLSLFTLAPAALILFYVKRFIGKLSYVDKRITKQKSFRLKIYILIGINLFRILFSVFFLIETQADKSHRIPSPLQLKLNTTTNCCQRQNQVSFCFLQVGIISILILSPVLVIFKIFDRKDETGAREDRQSILSEHSTIQQS